MLRRSALWAGLFVAAGLVAPEAGAADNVAAEIRSLTGQCTRIVWIRSSGGIGHPFGPLKGEKWTIMVLDTEEGKERQLLPDSDDYNHVMITPTGGRVIWTNRD
jgi:hypothetical protein